MTAIANPETTQRYHTPLDVCWQFSYEINIDQLRRLYSMAKRQQWDAEVHIDWSRAVDPSADILDTERMPFKETKFWNRLSKSQRETFAANNAAYALSQFLHGEQGALMVAAALTHAVPDYEAKLYVATQTMDEARHVEVFERYIRKIGKIYPIETFLKEVIDRTLTHDNWICMCVGMQMIVEGLALGSFTNMMEATNEPLFRQLIEYVIKDEARHVAYGNVYVKEAIADLHPDSLAEAEDFAFEALTLMRKARFGSSNGQGQIATGIFGNVLRDSGIDPKDFMKGMAEEYMSGWRPKALPGQIHTFKDLMMPALVRVGLVGTDRIRKKYEEAKVQMFDDLSLLQKIEVNVDSVDLENCEII